MCSSASRDTCRTLAGGSQLRDQVSDIGRESLTRSEGLVRVVGERFCVQL